MTHLLVIQSIPTIVGVEESLVIQSATQCSEESLVIQSATQCSEESHTCHSEHSEESLVIQSAAKNLIRVIQSIAEKQNIFCYEGSSEAMKNLYIEILPSFSRLNDTTIF